MSEVVEQRNPKWIIVSGPQKTFSIFFFHEFDMYFIALLKYLCNIPNKPIVIINASNRHPWHKVSNVRRAWVFEMETFHATLSAEIILISKPLAALIKWWWILEPWQLSADEYLSCTENFVIRFWTSSALILMKIIP